MLYIWLWYFGMLYRRVIEMKSCSHTVCGKEERIWLPSNDQRYGSVEKHSWCTTCGVVQNISDDRSKNSGYWMNKLSFVANDLELTQCQKRLIAKELESIEYFCDTFSAFGSCQEELFIKTVSKYCDTSKMDFDLILEQKRC